MGYSSKVRKMRRSAGYTPAAIGSLPIPDPRTWPTDVRERFRQATGASSPLDVFIFVFGRLAAMYLQDAVTALGLLDIDPSEWHAEEAYPVLRFDSGKIEEYSQRLAAAGYAVRILEPPEQSERSTENPSRAEVIDIASARRGRSIL